MVNARLHVICGNCGRNDMWKLKITRLRDDVTINKPAFEDGATLKCRNCSTIHDLKSITNYIDCHVEVKKEQANGQD